MRKGSSKGCSKLTYYKLKVAADLTQASKTSPDGHVITLGAGKGKTPIFPILIIIFQKPLI